jgi:hypothetical protein
MILKVNLFGPTTIWEHSIFYLPWQKGNHWDVDMRTYDKWGS